MNLGKKIQDAIRQILMEHWDPIGIRETPECVDEYDSYIGGIYHLLANNAEAMDIVDHLKNVEINFMGSISSDSDRRIRTALELLKLDVDLNETP